MGSSTKGVAVAATNGASPVETVVDDHDAVDDDVETETRPAGPGARVRYAALILSLLGLADATWLTISHFQLNLLKESCAASAGFNCVKVTTSPQSEILHIPVAVLGLAFYVAMTAINLPPLWKTTDVRVAYLRLAMAMSGIIFVLYLIYAELFLIKAVCEFCTGVHIVTFILFILIVTTFPSMVQRSGTWDEADWDEESEPA
jgi:uncharacterized membrane protein